jgi:hypothetical protein
MLFCCGAESGQGTKRMFHGRGGMPALEGQTDVGWMCLDIAF